MRDLLDLFVPKLDKNKIFDVCNLVVKFCNNLRYTYPRLLRGQIDITQKTKGIIMCNYV